MDIYSKRRRARRLNDDDAPDPVEKDADGDEVDPENVELDYGGVVTDANDAAEKQERREELVKGLGDDGPGLDFEEVFKGDREEDPDIEYSYDGLTKSAEETEREKDAAAIGEAVADELAARGLAGDADDATAAEDDEDAADGGPVEKAGERTADLLDDVQDDLRGLKRARSVRTLVEKYVADGGDPEDTMDEVFKWVDDHSEASIKVQKGGTVTVENAAT